MIAEEIPKLYYSIGEVSRLTQVDSHVLRYWETEFRELTPRKSRNGKRLYRHGDIKVILRIKELLYAQRFTIEGARRKMQEEARENGLQKDAVAAGRGAADRDLISELRRQLRELKDLLE